MALDKIYNYIGGRLAEPSGGNYLDNINPATGKAYSRVPASDARDIQDAVMAAKQASKAWSQRSVDERSEVLLRIAEGIEARLDDLAEIESIDNGKPLKLAKSVDIPRAAKNFRFYATAILHYGSTSYEMVEQPAINYTLRRPLGVVGCISPWNLPLYLFTWKIAPALAAGNTVVAKPSELTPMSAYRLSEICMEAGLPPGVLNIVHGLGPEVGGAITSHPEVKAISFTGGTKTGAEIARVVAPKFKKLSLELGGKNPNIIFDDAPFDDMMRMTLHSSFANQGQICLCGSRIFIQSGIYDKFKETFVKGAKRLKVGPPADKDTKIGAVVSEAHMNKILSYIHLAEEEGGTILAGGQRVIVPGEYCGGYYIAPTIIEGLQYHCRTNQEEIFGPVVTITPFDTEEEVLEMANSVRYGLSATVWTKDVSRAHRMAARLEAGIVWVNTWLLRDLRTPFGGVKDSGLGREGGFDALDFFTEPKNVCIKY